MVQALASQGLSPKEVQNWTRIGKSGLWSMPPLLTQAAMALGSGRQRNPMRLLRTSRLKMPIESLRVPASKNFWSSRLLGKRTVNCDLAFTKVNLKSQKHLNRSGVAPSLATENTSKVSIQRRIRCLSACDLFEYRRDGDLLKGIMARRVA